jgi:hydrogenase expression/formation protein HypE
LQQTLGGRPFRIAAVVFDFDGTLTQPGAIDFAAIHKAVGCPKGMGLLEFLAAIDDPQKRLRKEAVLVEAEMRAAELCAPNEGAEELLALLRGTGVPMAVITRNRQEAVERALLNLEGIRAEDFACMVSRDLPLSPKPSPEGVIHVARELGVQLGELLLIGDHAYDIEAGVRAGTLTMYLRNHSTKGDKSAVADADFVVKDLAEAREVIRLGLPLPVGKLPVDLMRQGLTDMAGEHAAVLVGAAVGEDAAAVDVAAAEVLVLASDPVTLASDSMAEYLVLANANDVAASGATPRWLLSTLLFPRGTSASQVLDCMRGVYAACAANGLALVGGHTEITDAVSRTVAVGMVAGTAPAAALRDKRRMRQGDRLLLTKGVAVEGTGLIAREFGVHLTKAGIPAAEVAECAAFLERMGVLAEAGIARGFPGVSAMHDVTEGGLATAVWELGAAGGRRLRVHMEKINVYPQTRRVCEALGLDPLGLIGSGSLLIACSPSDVAELTRAIMSAGIEVAEIGEVLGNGEGVEALEGGRLVEWPTFIRDEVARLERLRR